MDQASAPDTSRRHEIDDIKATALLRSKASVNQRGERIERLAVDQDAEIMNTGWVCVPCGTSFREWEAVKDHLLDLVTPISLASSGATHNALPEGIVAQPDIQTPVDDSTPGG